MPSPLSADRRRVTRLAALVLAFLPLPLAAQELVFDPAPTETCLAQAGDRVAQRGCIGQAALACMGQPFGDTTVGMGFCFDQELTLWDGKLNARYQSLRSALARMDDARMAGAPAQAEELRDMQRAWIRFRDARCGFEAAQWQGGTGAGPALYGCLMQVTGEQALYLDAVFVDAQ
jgi:uncharacterized protein YecT (DUF1311 family)